MQHAVGIDAGEAEGDEAGTRLEAQAQGRGLARDQDRGGAVADLARVSGRHLPVRDEGRLERRQRLGGRVPARRLVDADQRAHVRVRHLDRDDLVLEAALVDRRDRAAVRLERERVQLLPEVPLLGDDLRRDPLRHDLPAVEELVRQVTAVRAHRDAGHHLDAGRHDQIELPGATAAAALKFVCIEEPHWRSTVVPQTVSGHPATRGTIRADVPALLADLGDATHLHVLDLGRIEVVPLHQPVQHLAAELVAAGLRQGAVSPADRAADSVDDQGAGHCGSTVSPTRTRPGSTISA